MKFTYDTLPDDLRKRNGIYYEKKLNIVRKKMIDLTEQEILQKPFSVDKYIEYKNFLKWKKENEK